MPIPVTRKPNYKPSFKETQKEREYALKELQSKEIKEGIRRKGWVINGNFIDFNDYVTFEEAEKTMRVMQDLIGGV